MPRYHNINGNVVQFTAEEETARDAEEQAWADGALARAQADLRSRTNKKKECKKNITDRGDNGNITNRYTNTFTNRTN